MIFIPENQYMCTQKEGVALLQFRVVYSWPLRQNFKMLNKFISYLSTCVSSHLLSCFWMPVCVCVFVCACHKKLDCDSRLALNVFTSCKTPTLTVPEAFTEMRIKNSEYNHKMLFEKLLF